MTLSKRMAPPATVSSPAPGASGMVRGWATLRMLSCTMPMFSKMPVMLRPTQPAMLVSCQASGIAVTTELSPSSPRPQSHRDKAAMEVRSEALRKARKATQVVIARVCLR